MEFFWLTRDIEFFGGVTIETLTTDELRGEKTVVRNIYIKNSFENSILTDYLTTRTIKGQYHLISDKLKKLCYLYNRSGNWIPIVLIDQNKMCYIYWFWNMKTIDCISNKTSYNLDKTVKNLVIYNNKIDKESSFIVETELQQLPIIRLDLAESILRRGFIGFKLCKILVLEDQND